MFIMMFNLLQSIFPNALPFEVNGYLITEADLNSYCPIMLEVDGSTIAYSLVPLHIDCDNDEDLQYCNFFGDEFIEILHYADDAKNGQISKVK